MSHRVFVRLAVKPDCMDDLCSAVSKVVGKAREEEGCVTFEAVRAADESPVVMIWEHWTQKAHFDAHNAHPYMHALYGRLHDWLAGAPEIVEIKELEK